MALLSEEQLRRIFETLITQYTGIDPEEFEDIYNGFVSEYAQNEEAQKRGTLKKAYAKHRAKKAMRRYVRKKLAKRVAKQAAKKAAATAAQTGVRAGVGAGGAAAAGATAAPTAGTSILIWLAAWALVELGIQLVKFARHPIEESKKWTKRLIYLLVAIVALIIFILFFFYSFILALFGQEEVERFRSEKQTLLILNKTGQAEIANSGEITYTFNLSYPPDEAADDVVVTDTIPEGTQFVEVSAGTTLICEPNPCGATTKSFKWSSKANNIGAPFTTSFTVKVKALPAANDSYIVNIARGDATGLTPGQLPSADRALLLREVLTLLETRKLTFSQRNDREAIANGSGIIRRNDGANVTIDSQLLRAIAYLGQKGFTFNISSMVGNHARMTESGNISRHWDGHAFDVNNVNGYAVNTQSVDGKREVMNFMKTFNSLIETDLSPRQLICAGVGRLDPEVDALSMNNSQMAPGFSARVGDHTDHIHVGY